MKEDKKDNYNLCYENLCLEFAKHDPKEMAAKSGSLYDSEKKQFTLTCLNREYLISYPTGAIILKDDIEKNPFIDNINVWVKILIISYLHRCTKSSITKRWVPYRELHGVGHAYDGFALQGINKLVQFFGDKGDLLLKVGAKLGAKKYPSGDIGLEINVLPNVPMVLILWLGDEEFEADATILLDYSATKELHVEDLAGIGSLAVDEFIRVAKEILE